MWSVLLSLQTRCRNKMRLTRFTTSPLVHAVEAKNAETESSRNSGLYQTGFGRVYSCCFRDYSQLETHAMQDIIECAQFGITAF